MPNVRNIAKLGMLLAVVGVIGTLTGCVTGGEYREYRDYRDYREPPRHSQPVYPPGYEPSGSRQPDPRYGRGPLTIRVTGASYGAGRKCDATHTLRNACDGHRSCAVNVSNHLCGDPMPGTRKELRVDYFCEGYGGGGRRGGAPEGRDVYLSCD